MTGSLDKIEKKIRESGEAEIEKIQKDAEENIAHIKSEIQEESKRAYEYRKQERKKELDLIPRRIISDASMEKKRAIDAKKTELVENVFEEAKARILKLSKKDKMKLLNNLIENASRQIPDPVVYVDKKYSDLVEGAETESIGDFGVIVRSADGTVSVDNTLDSIIGRLKTSVKPEIVKIIF